ncbi:MAG: FMN-binding protein [Treponema sp.]|nr:FMN-binding protein [Treponema sp.]
MKFTVMIPLLLIAALVSACRGSSVKFSPGYYAAEAKNFDSHGWKEYVSIFINNNEIVTVEYNAKNAAGFIKSWDMDYMRAMNRVSGTYPNEYTRIYAGALLESQDPDRIDALSGATASYHSFKLLAKAAIVQAKAGDKSVSFIDIPEFEE